MKNRVAKVIVMLSLSLTLAGATNLWAGVCSVPSCRPRPQVESTANSPSFQDYLSALWRSLWF